MSVVECKSIMWDITRLIELCKPLVRLGPAMACPLAMDGGWWSIQCWIHVAPWLSLPCECFFFAIRTCGSEGGYQRALLLIPCTCQHCGELFHTIGFCIMAFQEAWGILKLCKRRYYLIDSTGIWVWSRVKLELLNDKYFGKPWLSPSVCFLFIYFITVHEFFFSVTGVWWTQKMSSATSSRSRCPLRCGTGWPPPSPDRWAWCCDVTRRNHAFAASSMLFRLEFLLRGKI